MSNPFDATVTREQADARFNNRELAQFHAYNPNGVLAQWNDLGTRLLAFGRGFLAYGDTGFYYDEITRLARQQRVNGNSLRATVYLIERTIKRGEAFLKEQGA